MRIFTWVTLLALVFLASYVYADTAPPVTEGGYKIEDSKGKQIGNAYADQAKAINAAKAQTEKCKCTTKVVAPKQRISYVKPKPLPPVIPPVVVPPVVVPPVVVPPVVVPPVVVPPAPPESLKAVKLAFEYPVVRTNGKALPISEIKLCTAFTAGRRATTNELIDFTLDVLPPKTTLSVPVYSGNYSIAMSCTDTDGNQGPLSSVVTTTL